MGLILLAVHKQYEPMEQIVGYRIYDKDTHERFDVSAADLYNRMVSGGLIVDGLEIESGKFKGNNGALSRYASIVNGQVFGSCPLIVLREYPGNVYIVVNCLGIEAKMHRDDLIRYASTEGLANAKIVDRDGTKYISRISGELEKDKKFRDLLAGDKTKTKLSMLDIKTYELNDNNFALCKCGAENQTPDLKIGAGCLGIEANGFANNIAKAVILPNTCTKLKAYCFSNMKNLQLIKLAEGTKEIPMGAFLNCESLVEIDLPNSIEKIGANAFNGCKNLKVIRTGPRKPDTAYNAIPRGTKIMPRR